MCVGCVLTVNAALLVAHLQESRQSIMTGMLLPKLPANCLSRMHSQIGFAQEKDYSIWI